MTNVLVVGAGAVGAMLALELAHHNVASVVLERSVTPPALADLHSLGGRSMELLRRLGLAARIRADGIDPDSSASVVWSQELQDPPVLVSHCPSANQLRRRYAAASDGNAPSELPQWVSGARLAQRLRETIASHPLIDLRLGWTFTDLRAESDGVVAGTFDTTTGSRQLVRARFVVGCDGAQSTVRQCSDITMEELRPPVRHCSVYFRSEELSRCSPESALSTLVIRGTALISRVEKDCWVGHLPIAGEELLAADPAELLRTQLGASGFAPEVLGVAQWDDSLPVAREYQRGPVYLAGEAAHRFHPHAGAADTGIEDAIDLGWKLAAVLQDWGGRALLSSYQGERRPRALMTRELLAREQESRGRFRRLTAAGASPEFLASVLRQELCPVATGIPHPGDRHSSSAVIWSEGTDPADPAQHRSRRGTRPGDRAPAVRLADGSLLSDHFGPAFTLVDLTDGQVGVALVLAAERRGMPMKHLPLSDPTARARWGRDVVLVRPDHHIAWRAGSAPMDWPAVLDLVTGR